uniref:Phosphoribosyltransferase domain-containing protein n=2 Tax=Odontella aurita TaxID=265563 RepID=A0A6U6F7J0_9STRA|mmetsp:Transcript_32071/g.96106  ORF Transcript_32071/g.96106 Transcript_32071/m.96106 type:complete len:398 (+) Transcript_32071:114-1307(+)
MSSKLMLLILVILSSLQRHCFATDDSSAPNGAGDCVEDVRHPEHPSHQPSTQKNGARRCNEVEDTRRTLWEQHSCRRQERQYQIIAAEACEDMARRMEYAYPDRFTFFPTKWDKFPDDTDDIEIGGFAPYNNISGKHVLFLASFHNNGVTMSQFQVLISLLQSFISSLTVILPYYPVGTMERVTREGTVATAATYAHMFSSLPNCGKPTRLMLYDLHTLQNRFYLHGNAVASLHSAIPLLKERMEKMNINSVAFPDDGAAKRFATLFSHMEVEIVVCGKTRGEGDIRKIAIQDGNAKGKNIVIVDDLVQTGGTLYESGKVLKEAGALSVNAYVTHAVFPMDSWKRFSKGGDRACFNKFWVTNSIPTTTNQLPLDDVFEVLDLMDLLVNDLDYFPAGI